jgi:hypothetical protein
MPYLNGETGVFLTLLQQTYAAMSDRTVKQIVFSDSVLGGTIRWWGTLWRFTETHGVLVARTSSGVNIQRTMSAGAWGTWEYINPPMAVGTEYRTTERWMGKPVYAQLVSLGQADGEQFFMKNIAGLSNVIRAEVVCGGVCAAAGLSYSVSVSYAGISISTDASDALTGQQLYAALYYTR